MVQGVPVGTLLLPPGSTTLWKNAQFRVGDVVLPQVGVRPRHMWKRGPIEDLRPGRDGKTSTFILRTQDGGRLARPVQLVIPLEVDQCGEDVEDDKL